jgi:hypothetical protein
MKSEAASGFSTNIAPPAPWWGLSSRGIALLALIAVATIAVYLPSLRNGWVSDDLPALVHNPDIRTASFIKNAFTHDVQWSIQQHNPNLQAQAHSASYRPLQIVWWAINAQLFGVNHPAPWHLMKIVLQVIAVLLCFRVAQLLTGEVVVALLAAAIFGLMPAHVEPVVWVSAIPEPLSTVFELAALVFLIQRKPGWSRGLMLSVLFFAFAILTHESAIFFPVIAFACVMIFEAGPSADTRPARQARTVSTNAHIVRALTVCVPFLFVILVYAFARMHVLGDHAFGMPHTYTQAQMHGVVEADPLRGPAQIAMTIPMVVLTYLGILAIPGIADPMHSIEWTTHLDPQVFIAWAALTVLALIAIVFASRSPRRKVYLFCAIWSLVTIAPALKIDSLWWLNQDRYLYAPSFGWSLALGLAIFEISMVGARARLAVSIATAILLLSYGVATIRGQRYWYDNLSYYSRAVQVKPNDPYYHLAVGNLLEEAKDNQGAVKQLEIAESLKPQDPYIHIRLAQTYMKLGRLKDFEREYNAFEDSGASVIKSVHVGPDGKPDEQSAAAPQAPSAVAH